MSGVEIQMSPQARPDRSQLLPDGSAGTLTARFLSRLPARLANLDSQIERLRRAPFDRVLLQQVMYGFHSLAGIGGTYGYPLISEVARDAEERCMVLAAGTRISNRSLAALTDSVRVLRNVGGCR